MRRQRWRMPLLALVFAMSLNPTLTHPVRDEELDTSTKLLGSSVVTSVSVVTGSSENVVGSLSSNADRSRVIPSKELPGTPADLLRPDRFQFYTLNQDGNVVTKQMTEREIQTLIAAGGGHLPVDDHEPQNAGDVPTGGMKVADVVHKVQKVLKSELNRFSPAMTSMPTIPGHANAEWSSILPAIFGGESENVAAIDSGSTTLANVGDSSVGTDATIAKIPQSTGVETLATKLPAEEASTTIRYEIPQTSPTTATTEKPMIQVPVITVDQKLSTINPDEENSTPVFHMLDTISADKMHPKNYTQSDDKLEKINSSDHGIIGKPSKPPKDETKVSESSLNEKVPTTEGTIISKLSESVAPEMVSVISETHSTSIKVSGHEEVRLREPPVNLIDTPVAPNKPVVSVNIISTEAESGSTPTTKEPGLLAQGASFFGNLTNAISASVTDFVYGNDSSDEKITEEIITAATTVDIADRSTERPHTTKTTGIETTGAPIRETVTSMRPDEEPVYEIIPEIIPDKMETMPAIHGASPSETETTSIVPSSTIGIDNSPSQTNPTKISRPVVDGETSTTATFIAVEKLNETTSGKPTEPIPTELADSLSSMISQISNEMPSVLPVGQDAGLDGTSKNKVVDMLAEEHGGTDEMEKSETEKTSTITPKPEMKITLSLSSEPEKGEIVDALKLTEPKQTTIASADITETIEISRETPSITETPIRDSHSTTMGIDDVSSIENTSTPRVPVTAADIVVTSVKMPISDSEKLKIDGDPLPASSDTATDKILSTITTEQSFTIDNATKSAIIDATFDDKLTTEKPYATDVAGGAAIPAATTIPSDYHNTETTAQAQTDGPSTTASVLSNLDNEKNFTSMDIHGSITNDNNTEMPIVHIAITESKPTDIENSNASQAMENDNDRPESPVVRIQLTDPVTVINNMIQSANVNATAGPMVPLILPETGMVPANSIASGLIAGFPSSTQATTGTEPTTIVDFIKSQSEIPNKRTDDVDKSSIAETPEPAATEITDNIQLVETTTTLKNIASTETDIIPEIVVADEPQRQPTTVEVDAFERTTTDNPEKKESTEATVIPLIAENVDVTTAFEETTTTATTQTSGPTVTVDETIESETKIPEPSSIPPMKSESGEKMNKLSDKVPEIEIGTSAKPEIHDPSTSIPEKLEEPKNSTMSEVPVVRIDVASETEFEKIPSITVEPTKLPMVEITNEAPSTKPTPVEETIDTRTPESGTTAANDTFVESTTSSELSLSTTEAEMTDATIGKNEPKPDEDTVEQTPKPDMVAVSHSVEKKATTSIIPISTAQQTEQVRIQVNDTAVLVTKRPVSETSGQTPENPQKTTVNQSPNETSIGPESSTASTVESPPSRVIDEHGDVERLPVPMTIVELSSNNDAAPSMSFAKPDFIVLSENKNDSTIGEVERNDENTTVKVVVDDHSRKPLEKNNDGHSTESSVDTESSTKNGPTISDEILVHGDNDSPDHFEPSIKVETTTTTNFGIPSTASTMSSGLSEMEVKPADDSKNKTAALGPEPATNINENGAIAETVEEKWTLIPQQVNPAVPEKTSSASYPKESATTVGPSMSVDQPKKNVTSNRRPSVPLVHRQSVSGLDSTVKNLDPKISSFADLCNELGFRFWTATTKNLNESRSLAVSPFGMTSLLAMIFLGAREPTSSRMNEVLKLDDNLSFNPHRVFQNITDTVRMAKNQGIANAAFVREIFASSSKVRSLMPFYKRQAQRYYDGIVEEADFDDISELVRDRTNQKIRGQTGRRIYDFMGNTVVPLRSPLAAMSANVFQTNCNDRAASSEGRDGELYFPVSPAARKRELVPVPAMLWKSGVLGGYVTSLDATAVALGGLNKLVSTIFVIPGSNHYTAPGDSLEKLERRFIKSAANGDAWKNLLKFLIPRPDLELQVPKFSHRSVINATAALKGMGLEELFSKQANLKAMKGVAPDVHVADVFQMNLFSTCGDENVKSGRHHVEVYPTNSQRNARDNNRYFEEENYQLFDGLSMNGETSSTGSTHPDAPQREARWKRQQNETTKKSRVQLNTPFLYFVRHNPTGLILHMGRFNPRLSPSTNSGDAPIKTTTPSPSTGSS